LSDGTYSISRECTRFGSARAIDWNWGEHANAWSLSEMDGQQWVSGRLLTESELPELLSHFALDTWADEFPLERVITRPPRDLAVLRRAKEYEFDLSVHMARSDTLGHHIPALEHAA
jgi:hypothetical protein